MEKYSFNNHDIFVSFPRLISIARSKIPVEHLLSKSGNAKITLSQVDNKLR